MQRSDPDTPTFGVCMYWKRGVIPRVTVCWWDGVDILVCTLTLFTLLFTPNLSIYIYLRRTDYYDIRPEHMQEARSHSISRISSVLRERYIYSPSTIATIALTIQLSRTNILSTSLRLNNEHDPYSVSHSYSHSYIILYSPHHHHLQTSGTFPRFPSLELTKWISVARFASLSSVQWPVESVRPGLCPM